MLDRAQPRHRQLLDVLVGQAEGRVVGGHDQQVGAGEDLPADRLVVEDLEADRRTDPGAAGLEDRGPVAGGEVGHPVDERGEEAEERPVRDELAERGERLLGVVAVRGLRVRAPAVAGARVPHEHGVGDVLPGPLQDGAEQHRGADGVGRRRDDRGGVLVGQRVDVGGVLGPQDEVDRVLLPRVDALGQVEGALHVVVEHRAALGVEVQAGARHVALHGGDADRAVVRADRGVHAGGRRGDGRAEQQRRARPARPGHARARAGRPGRGRGARAAGRRARRSRPARRRRTTRAARRPPRPGTAAGCRPARSPSRPQPKPPNGHPRAQRLRGDPHGPGGRSAASTGRARRPARPASSRAARGPAGPPPASPAPATAGRRRRPRTTAAAAP